MLNLIRHELDFHSLQADYTAAWAEYYRQFSEYYQQAQTGQYPAASAAPGQ